MPRHSLYVTHGSEKDLSRWLTINPRGQDWFELRLENLRHPGEVSNLDRLVISRSAMVDVLKGGFVQVRMPEGYGQLTGGDPLEISLKGTEDTRSTRCSFDLAELRALVESIAHAEAVAV